MCANTIKDHTRRWTEWMEAHPWTTRTALGLAAVSLALTAISPWYQIYVRDDESLPQYSFFILHKGALPERGDYVAFEMAQEYADRVQPSGFQRPYARVGKLWLKEAYGLAGDTVQVKGRIVFVNDQPVASVIQKDIFKKPVEPAQFVSPIPEGQYYLGLPHPRSFDSRVIGYVSAKDVKGVVWPIF
ncbi:MAG: S26 family signal peptidase [Nitrospirota bacterium]|nr:S26 family signal peptidase [Nitrospirota bacterium]